MDLRMADRFVRAGGVVDLHAVLWRGALPHSAAGQRGARALLNNSASEPADFEAFFTPDSPYELSVFPTRGALPPPGKEGTTFVVSFTPKEYGKTLVGTLVIRVSGSGGAARCKSAPAQRRLWPELTASPQRPLSLPADR